MIMLKQTHKRVVAELQRAHDEEMAESLVQHTEYENQLSEQIRRLTSEGLSLRNEISRLNGQQLARKHGL